MTYTFKLSRRIARLRAPLFASLVLGLAGCNTTDSLSPDGSAPPEAAAPDPTFSTSFAGGIPFGTFAQPNTEFGARYNGAMENIWPDVLLSELADIKSRGGRVVLMFAGSEQFYKDADGHFSMSMWKARVDRFKGVNFSAYVNDGTIVAHYLIDEPHDPYNWNGQPIPPSTLEEMAKYSKSIWPSMATVVREAPHYLNTWSGTYQYLDAAWAQYLSRMGDANEYIRYNVSEAQKKGLALIVGLNFMKGGDPNGTTMTATELQNFGSALLSSSYPCAFISYQWNSSYLSNTAIKSAMDVLRGKAQNRSTKSCHAGAASTTPDPTPSPTPSPTPTVTAHPFAYGLNQTPLEAYSARWTGSVYKADPSSLVRWLGRADSAKMKVIVTLAPAGRSINADGTFSLTKWKAQVDAYRSLSLDRYITSKALYLHNLVDQPSCAACWGGKAIPWETVEQMAQYSKSIWPGLATTARVAPSKLAAATFHWNYLDAGWAEYNTKLGDLRTYLSAESAQAKNEGLGLIAGLNLLDASGYNTPGMTASQIKEYGTILAGNASVCALVGRSYDATYLNQTGISQALDSVGTVAKRRTSASCVVS
jgi:hypothetical protein